MKKFILLICIILLSGCSTKFAYNNASWLVYWYMDDYIELNKEQEEEFDVFFEQWMNWHRTEELPRYAEQLNEIVNDVKTQNISTDRIAYHRDKVRSHWVRAREYIAPDLNLAPFDHYRLIRAAWLDCGLYRG